MIYKLPDVPLQRGVLASIYLFRRSKKQIDEIERRQSAGDQKSSSPVSRMTTKPLKTG